MKEIKDMTYFERLDAMNKELDDAWLMASI